MKYLKKYKLFESIEDDLIDMFAGNILSNCEIKKIPEVHVTRYGRFESKTVDNIYVIWGDKLWSDDYSILQELYHYENHIKSLGKEYYFISLTKDKVVIIVVDITDYRSDINYGENLVGVPENIKRIIKKEVYLNFNANKIPRGIHKSDGSSSNIRFPEWEYDEDNPHYKGKI